MSHRRAEKDVKRAGLPLCPDCHKPMRGRRRVNKVYWIGDQPQVSDEEITVPACAELKCLSKRQAREPQVETRRRVRGDPPRSQPPEGASP